MEVSTASDLDLRLAADAADFLCGELPPEAMAWRLREAGFYFDADLLLLSRRGEGPFVLSDPLYRGRKVWVSTLPPSKAACGDIWYDTRELMPTILIPKLKVYSGRVSRPTGKASGWMSLQPVRRWQALAFCKLARVSWVRSFEAAVKFRNRRWEPVDGLQFSGGLIHAEARAYAGWLSKELQSVWSHNALYLALSVELHDLLVGQGAGKWEEWTGDTFDGGRIGIVGGMSYQGILPVSIVEPDSFSRRRMVRTFISIQKAAQLRRGFKHIPPEKEFRIRTVLER